MAFDLAAYKAKLKTQYNIPDDDLAAFDTEITPGFLRQDAFSRRQQELNTREQEINTRWAVVEPFEQYLQSLEQRFGIPREQWSNAQIQIANANAPADQRQQPTPTGLTQEQVNVMIQQRVDAALAIATARFDEAITNTQRGTAILLDFIPDARDQWRQEYSAHGAFPKADFERFIGPDGPGSGMPLNAAWSLFRAPYDAKNQEAAFQKQLETAAAEAYRRGRSEATNLEPDPTGSMHSGRSVLDGVDAANRAAGNLKPGEQPPAGPTPTENRARFNAAYSRALNAAESGAAPQSS